MASSGDYFQYFSADMKNHHILDPRTGYSSPYLSGTTVIAPDCMEADALATALMVAAPEDGLALIERLPKVEALLVTKELDRLKTTGF